MIQMIEGILIPFLGTGLGAAGVFLLRGEVRTGTKRVLTGFAAGIMVAASFFSLLIPALEYASDRGRLAFVPGPCSTWWWRN